MSQNLISSPIFKGYSSGGIVSGMTITSGEGTFVAIDPSVSSDSPLEEIAMRLDELAEEHGIPELTDLSEGVAKHYFEIDTLEESISVLNRRVSDLIQKLDQYRRRDSSYLRMDPYEHLSKKVMDPSAAIKAFTGSGV